MTQTRTTGYRALLAAMALAMLVASCGGSSSEETTAAPTTEAPAATTAAPTETTAATTEAPAAETTAAPDTTAAPGGDDDAVFALGEELFLRTAGDVGCASCHGPEALGNVGPNIQGKTVADIKTQLNENELMEFLKKALSPEDIEAVAVYLKYLKDNASG